MADNATVGVNIGGANITTSGALTGTLLQDLEKFITAQHGFNFIQYTGQDVSGLGQQDVLVDLPPIDPVINLPDSAGAFMQDLAAGALTLTGGGANTSIAAGGSINYSGAAAEIVAVGAMGTVSSTGAGAVIGVGDGSYNVVGSGQGDTYEMDVGAGNVIDVTATGGGNLFEMDSISGAGPTDIATINALAGGNTWDLLSGNADATLGVADTVFATAGTSTINAAGSDVYYGGAASTMFLGAGGANTVFGGSGNDTVHGDGGVTYYAGSGDNIFYGAAASSTVYAGSGHDTILTGSTGDLVYMQGSSDTIVGSSGNDTLEGGTVAPTVFATNNERLNLIGTQAAGVIVDIGNNATVDASQTQGGNTYWTSTHYGSSTLIGSLNGPETFVVGTDTPGTATITIQNWHIGDSLQLQHFGSADLATATAAVSAGASSFTLSDGTTVAFVGNHPTNGALGSYT